jgi:hypothetical protein
MSTLQSSGLEPAVRLKSLKNAKRRVMPGEEEIQNLDQFNPDIAGTANPMPAPAPTQNIPQPAIGSQVSAQSYDPRANQVMTAPPVPVGPPQPVMANPNPPPSQEPGMNEKRLGEALPSAVGTQPPQATEEAQIPYGPQLPPYPLLGSGLKEFLKKGPGLRGEALQKEMEQQAQAIKEAKPYGPEEKPPERVGFKLPGIVPYEKNPITEAWEGFVKGGKERQKQMIEQAQGEKAPTPEVAAQEGQPPMSERERDIQAFKNKSDEVAANPEHLAEFEKQTGEKLTPELHADIKVGEEAKDYLESGSEDKTGLSEQAKRLVENIEANKATDADKYMIGLALLMPLIVGGMFGKEAGFGALAGGMKGMGGVLGQRTKDIREDEELLAEINKERNKGGEPPKLSAATNKYVEDTETRGQAAQEVMNTIDEMSDWIKGTGVRGYLKYGPQALKPADIAKLESMKYNLLFHFKSLAPRGLNQAEFKEFLGGAIPDVKLSPEANEAILQNFRFIAEPHLRKYNKLSQIQEANGGYVPENIRVLIEKPANAEIESSKKAKAGSALAKKEMGER